jgi:outer membrane protein OmpA-like peptidoglycan-associated protein/outer membrane protein W
MRLRSVLLLAFAVIATSRAASAQPIQGIYIGAGAGLRAPTSPTNTPITHGINGNFDINEALGYDSNLSLGYALGNGWRFELEGTFGKSNVKGTSGTTFPATGSGSVRNLGLMANALFDMDIGSPYVYPYIGAGIGYQSTRLDGFAMTATSKPLVFSASGDAGGIAGQAIAGVSFPIPNMPGLSLTADYRFMDILGGETFNGLTSTGGAPVLSATKFHNQFNQTLMFGVRYAFNTPPPAAVAPQASLAAPPAGRGQGGVQTYQVDFGLDIATISDRTRWIVKQAAESARRRDTRIEVTQAASDKALSERRARALAGALIGEGVPSETIAIHARGDAERSPNRRVEIVID